MKGHTIPKVFLTNIDSQRRIKKMGNLSNQFKHIVNSMNFESQMIEEYFEEISYSNMKRKFKNSMKVVISFWCGSLLLNAFIIPGYFYTVLLEITCLNLNLLCYMFTLLMDSTKHIEGLNAVVLLGSYISTLASMFCQVSMLETNFAPTLQINLLMFSHMPTTLNNAMMLWVVTYGSLSLGIVVSIGQKESLSNYTDLIKNGSFIENFRRIPLFDKNIHGIRFIFGFLTAGLAFLLLCIYMNFLDHFFRRSTFMKIRNIMNEKTRIKSSLRLKLHWIDSIMPKSVTDEFWWHTDDFKFDNWLYVKCFDNVTILFADLVGFTQMNRNRTALRIATTLNDLFDRFDYLSRVNHCEKLCSLGDCYYCVSGCPIPRNDHSKGCVEMGLGMCEVIMQFNNDFGEDLNIQIGIHSCTVIGAIIGKERYRFDIYSSGVTTTKTLESTGQPGRLHISETVYDNVKTIYKVEKGSDLISYLDSYLETPKSTLKTKILKTYFIDPKVKFTLNDFGKENNLKSSNSDLRQFSSQSESSYSEESLSLENKRKTRKKRRYRYNIEDAVVFIECLKSDPEQNIQLLKNPPLSHISLMFVDKEVEWHFRTSNYIFGNDYHIQLMKLIPFLDCLTTLIYSFLIYLSSFIMFPEMTSKTLLIMYFSLTLSLLISIIKLVEWYELKYRLTYSKRFYIYNFFSNNFVKSLICFHCLSVPLILIIVSFHDCRKMKISYSYTVYFFTLIIFSLFIIPLYVSVNYFVKLFILVFNISVSLVALLYKPCVRQNMHYTYPDNSCFGKMNVTDVHYYYLVQCDFVLQIFVTFLLMILMIKENEINLRTFFYVARELDINMEEAHTTICNTQDFLYNIIPIYIFDELKSQAKNQRELTNFNYAVSISRAGVVFSCINNLFSKTYLEDFRGGLNVLRLLHRIIYTFDIILKKDIYKDVEKIKTINDCYILASGLHQKDNDNNNFRDEHLYSLMYYAFDILKSLSYINEKSIIGPDKFQMKIGYNFGPLHAGLIGGNKPMYDIWGDTVNSASKLCSLSSAGTILVPEYVRKELISEFEFRPINKCLMKNEKSINLYTCLGSSSRATMRWQYSLQETNSKELCDTSKKSRFSIKSDADKRFSNVLSNHSDDKMSFTRTISNSDYLKSRISIIDPIRYKT